jgi:membrane-associated phospholipid phosphatase
LRPIYETEVTADGFGFPSGHATAATIVWGSLAWWLDVGTKRRRIVGAAVVVALVALSRIALGVHYVTDVVAGIGVGLAYLLAIAGIRDRLDGDERTVLWLAVALTAAGGVLHGGQDGWLAVGAALGATIGWIATDAPIQPWAATRTTVVRSLVVFVAVVGVAGGTGGALLAVGVPTQPVLGVTTLITAGLLVATPGIDSIAAWIETGA